MNKRRKERAKKTKEKDVCAENTLHHSWQLVHDDVDDDDDNDDDDRKIRMRNWRKMSLNLIIYIFFFWLFWCFWKTLFWKEARVSLQRYSVELLLWKCVWFRRQTSLFGYVDKFRMGANEISYNLNWKTLKTLYRVSATQKSDFINRFDSWLTLRFIAPSETLSILILFLSSCCSTRSLFVFSLIFVVFLHFSVLTFSKFWW